MLTRLLQTRLPILTPPIAWHQDATPCPGEGKAGAGTRGAGTASPLRAAKARYPARRIPASGWRSRCSGALAS